ncbi:MAG TPA: hypothetical protein V6C81_09660 [Planktothrix sp.]
MQQSNASTANNETVVPDLPQPSEATSLIVPWAIALGSFVLMGTGLVCENYNFTHHWSSNIFVHLANSFLHGQVYLLENAPKWHDLSKVNGHTYAYWPPLLAFIYMPFVAMFNVKFGDRWITIALAALNAIPAWLIASRLSERFHFRSSKRFLAIATVFFVLGTSNLVLSYVGLHYYATEIASSLFYMTALALLLKKEKSYNVFAAASACLALSTLGRAHLILSFPLFLLFAFDDGEKFVLRFTRQVWNRISILCAATAAAVSFSAWYNWARFGNIFDNGIKYHEMASRFRSDFEKYGYLSFHYVRRNFYYEVLRTPFSEQLHMRDIGPFTTKWEGYSVFYQSPLLLYSFVALRELAKKGHRLFVSSAWLTTIVTSLLILTVMGTGWVQFGARYMFDVVPLLFVLSIIGCRGKLSPLFIVATVASIAVNVSGLWMYCHELPY